MTLGAAQPAADGHVEAGNVDSVAASVLLAPCTQSFAALRLTQVGRVGGEYANNAKAGTRACLPRA